ncbi:MAG: FAD-dependent oxidoreductase [Planctomycetota bacterium]|jgi:protoporphyrinogen oxidase
MTESRQNKVVVLGAGPGGLAAAHVLTEAGADVDVLELNDYVGGLCVTNEKNGFRFDLGGHRWFTKNEELHKWFLRLMEGELCTVKRTSRIYFDGKYFSYPISTKNVIKNAGLFTSAHALLSYLVWALRDFFSRREPQNIKEAYCTQFGHKLFDMFFRRYTEKVWGYPCEELSADWVSQRTKGLSFLSTLKDALIKSRSVVSLVDEFVYPRLGYQRICERMAEDVEKWSGRVHLGSPARSLKFRGPSDWIVEYGKDSNVRTIHATDVVSTLPLTHLAQMIDPPCSDETKALARSLRFRDLITVTVMVRKPQVTSDTWLYLHDEDLLFARIHEPKNWSSDMVPGPEYSSIVAECFCTKDDAIWRRSDKEIADRVIADLADKLGFITRDEVIDSCVIRSRFAYPVYDLGYREKLDKVYAFVRQHPGLHIVGRGGTFRYNNADHSIEMGRLLGKKLLGEATDHISVNTEKEYHEEIRRTQETARRGVG